MADAGLFGIEPSGKHVLLVGGNAFFVADVATKTVRALYGARGASGGTSALLEGDVFAAGSATGVEVWDVAAKTRSFIAGNGFYGVTPVPGRARAMLIASSAGVHLAEIP